jgi:hydrogen peroxide-dependent heme synthase
VDDVTSGEPAVPEALYAYYPVFRAPAQLRRMDPGVRDRAAHEFEMVLKEMAEWVTLRGAYSCAGLRPDADLMLWLVATSPDAAQDALVALRRTELGRELELTHAFMGLVRPAEFTRDHAPAFARGEAPRTYLCVYPFVRTPDWYLLPSEERAALLREHGEMGRRFPDVLANTTSAFGLSDWEWILAFEADDLGRIVDCIRTLREAVARLYTKEEIPFITGIRKSLPGALADLT